MKTEFTKKFPSGLRVVFKKMSGLHTVSFGCIVGVGSRNEDPKVNGYSHFIEHLLFKGTQRRTAVQISEEIDDIGGQINAYTSKDTTCYYTRSASNYLDKCMDIISDMLFNSKFDPKDIQLEKKVILEEISMGEDLPDEVCHDLIATAIFGNHPLGQTIVGLEDNIKNSDRNSILHFKNSHYTPSNIVISVAGDGTFSQVCELVEKYFESNFTKSIMSTSECIKPDFCNEFLYKFKDVEQSHLAVAYKSLEVGNVLSPANAIMCNVLGGGMSSRLFQEIREKRGLAYSVFAYSSAYSDCGYLEIYCGTNPTNVNEVAELLNSNLSKFVKFGVTDVEFARGKAQLHGNTLLAQESSMSIMTAYGTYMLRRNELYDLEKKIELIKNATKAQVSEVIDYTFSGKFAAAYVGKKIDDYDFIKLMK